jgi:tellurite resistance protein TerC
MARTSLFLSGYFLEKSLSVDNLFVFMAIFASFKVADIYQHRVLYFGIIGAIILRFVFIALGTSLLFLGKWVLVAFALFVLWSAYAMWKNSNGDDGDDEDYTNHWSVKYTSKLLPVWTKLDGHNFFTLQNGKRYITPLFLCLVCMEVADVMFAFDSVPAVITITQDPFLVYASNIFAILGLRSMYFMLASAKRFLCHLEKSVIVILGFIGIKMLLDVSGVFHISPNVSLLVVLGLLTVGVLSSLVFPEKAEA